jgi:hexulose-6-phosphate isomerase
MIEESVSVLEKFELLKRLGFDGVELDSPSELDEQEVLDARETSGLPIHGVVDSVHWQKTLSDPDPAVRDAGRAGLEHALHQAKAFGASTVLLVPAVVNKEVSYADAYIRSQAEIRKVLPLAEEVGVRIALENVWNQFLLSPLEFARYIDEFESDWIGAYFDVGNIVNYGWPEHWIRTLGPRILKIDIKEFSRQQRNDEGLWQGFRVELGEGDCDWPAVNAALEEIGYAGWATAEIPGGDAERLRDIAERMDRILPT